MSIIFSKACGYAIRGLVEMAKNPDELTWRVQDLAERTKTPAPFLAKTFQLLVKGRILKSAKGRKGGFTLAKPADEIFLIEIVEIIDGSALTQDCALGLSDCGDENPCPFHKHWGSIRKQLVDALSTETLSFLSKK